MSRELTSDFKGLLDFFTAYNLVGFENNKELRLELSRLHKKYFSLLTFIGEIQGQKRAKPSTIELEYLTESSSDIGNALFLMVHGGYKASRMMLRSSIETFLKGFNSDIIPSILVEKSMYKMFDDVKALTFFQHPDVNSIIVEIHRDYKELCKDIHTASPLNMQKLTSLKYFPSFDKLSSAAITTIAVRLTVNYLSLLTIKFKQHVISMHHRNREVIIDNIPKKYKKLILGI